LFLFQAKHKGAVFDTKMKNYFQVPNAIYECGLTPYELSVYSYIARCSNQGAKAFPSYNNIAKRCGMGKTKTIETIDFLDGVGLITIRHRRGDEPKKNLSNEYVAIRKFNLKMVQSLIEERREIEKREKAKKFAAKKKGKASDRAAEKWGMKGGQGNG